MGGTYAEDLSVRQKSSLSGKPDEGRTSGEQGMWGRDSEDLDPIGGGLQDLILLLAGRTS